MEAREAAVMRLGKRLMLLVAAMVLLLPAVAAGKEDDDSLEVQIYVTISNVCYEGDSMVNVCLPTFYRMSPMVFKDEKQRERYNRMVNNVKKVLPLAQLTRQTLVETYEYLMTLPTEEERKEHIKLAEKGIKKQYGPMVRKLSRSQGKLLIKLIDRECGQSSYEMVKAFLGPLRANFYQAVAGLFGTNLSKHYDPEGDDRYIEAIVRMIESGQL